MRVLLEENKNKTKQNRASLRKQPTLGDATTGFPPLRVKGLLEIPNTQDLLTKSLEQVLVSFFFLLGFTTS